MLKVFSIKQSHNIFVRKLFLIWAFFSLYSASASIYANTVVKAATLNFPPYEFIENEHFAADLSVLINQLVRQIH